MAFLRLGTGSVGLGGQGEEMKKGNQERRGEEKKKKRRGGVKRGEESGEQRSSYCFIVMLRASDNPHINRNSEQKGNTACRRICAKPYLDSHCSLLVIFCGLRRGGLGRSAVGQACSQMQILWNKWC